MIDLASQSTPPLIPATLFFTYKTSIAHLPEHLRANVRHTVEAYKHAMGNRTVRTRFLSDDDCRAELQEANPELLPHFDAELQGMYKADICRVASLYNSGGYYFDVDLKAVEPAFIVAPETSFSTVVGAGSRGAENFFQAFMASSARHPILHEALLAMLAYYTGTPLPESAQYMGTATLHQAYATSLERDPALAGGVQLLRESQLDEGLEGAPLGSAEYTIFPEVRRQAGVGCCCNYVVHSTENVHFFSRIRGTHWCR